MTAYVRKASKDKGIVPAWGGTKMALSESMTDAVLALLHDASQGDCRRARDAGRATDAGGADSGCRNCRDRACC